ncbi:uncharacterized protein LOC118649042 isoform X5 [Myotis myotis]|uniref:uncharacterized protein LOC118649042 isoform X5 n=1 Tax=Myotis myotis TaxID=51298 RepID=UPI00174BD672|nr:uncharacterized protein LOC118649042 isoform X5 [Myotis myotis]
MVDAVLPGYPGPWCPLRRLSAACLLKRLARLARPPLCSLPGSKRKRKRKAQAWGLAETAPSSRCGVWGSGGKGRPGPQGSPSGELFCRAGPSAVLRRLRERRLLSEVRPAVVWSSRSLIPAPSCREEVALYLRVLWAQSPGTGHSRGDATRGQPQACGAPCVLPGLGWGLSHGPYPGVRPHGVVPRGTEKCPPSGPRAQSSLVWVH